MQIKPEMPSNGIIAAWFARIHLKKGSNAYVFVHCIRYINLLFNNYLRKRIVVVVSIAKQIPIIKTSLKETFDKINEI